MFHPPFARLMTIYSMSLSDFGPIVESVETGAKYTQEHLQYQRRSMAERVNTAIANADATTATSTYTLRYHFIEHKLIARITKFAHLSCSALTRVLLYFVILVTSAFGQT